MEFSKENIFDVRYTSVLEKNLKNKKGTSRLIKFIRENKIISISIIAFSICICINIVLICNFLAILHNANL